MNFRDIELLSSYLDGQLNPSESARLETRLSSDPNLRAAMDDLRATRRLLRQLPSRKAPRNFTLTRKMVGLKPPLPRAYSTFRFATALATLLLFITFALNAVTPRLAPSAALRTESGGGCEGCGGGAPEEPAFQAPATEAPAATEPPAAPSLAIPLTATAPATAADNAQISPTATLKEAPTETLGQAPPEARNQGPVPVSWQLVLGILAVVSAAVALLVRWSAAQKWK